MNNTSYSSPCSASQSSFEEIVGTLGSGNTAPIPAHTSANAAMKAAKFPSNASVLDNTGADNNCRIEKDERRITPLQKLTLEIVEIAASNPCRQLMNARAPVKQITNGLR